MICMKTAAIASRLLAMAGLQLPVIRVANRAMLRFLLMKRVPADQLAEFYRDLRRPVRWLGWATRAGLIQGRREPSPLARALRQHRDLQDHDGAPAGWEKDLQKVVYELTEKGEREARKAFNHRSLSRRYHDAVWLFSRPERWRVRRPGRLAVVSTLGLGGYVASLLWLFHDVLELSGIDAALGEGVCLVGPIVSIAVAVGLARAKRLRWEAEEDRYSEEQGRICKEELEMMIESGEAAWEEYAEDSWAGVRPDG